MSITAVIGLGQLGAAVARYIAEHGGNVIAIDRDMARVEALKDYVDRAACLDATDERALRAAGVADASAVVMAFAEDQLEAAVLTTMVLREIGVGQIISRAATDIQAKVLRRLGVSEIVFPERRMGIQIAKQLLNPRVNELLPLGKDTIVGEVRVPDSMVGKSLADSELRSRFKLNAIAIKRSKDVARDDGTVVVEWDIDHDLGAETILRADEVLVVLGRSDAVRGFSGS